MGVKKGLDSPPLYNNKALLRWWTSTPLIEGVWVVRDISGHTVVTWLNGTLGLLQEAEAITTLRRNLPQEQHQWECQSIVLRVEEHLMQPNARQLQIAIALWSCTVWLRGPAAILFISCDACSDSIAKLFQACFCGGSYNYRAMRCKMGYRTDVSV